MKILHTEASPGWGGQELRILQEAKGMRARGHDIILAIQKGGGLIAPAQAAGFKVFPLSFKKQHIFQTLYHLLKLIHREKIELINTHSSLDAWIAGVAGKLTRRPIIRTRHLSTPIRTGFNSRVLYKNLADYVVTTCEETAETIRQQAHLSPQRCFSVPTGVDPKEIECHPKKVEEFRNALGIKRGDCLVGTLCVLRGWKGITHLLQAAKLLENKPWIKWVVVGSGVSEQQFLKERRELGLEKRVIFTGHLTPPYNALAAMDIFVLLSWANEGVSQASLQAAWLQKPLITTSIGGLKEVCIPNKTGFIVPAHHPEKVAEAVLKLADQLELREQMGQEAKKLVEEKFLFAQTLDHMEAIIKSVAAAHSQ